MKTANRITTCVTLILIAVSSVQAQQSTHAAEVEEDFVDKALSLQQKGDCQGALIEFEKALQKDPNDTVALLDRAILRFDTLGDQKGAFTDINQALKINMIDSKALRTRADFKAEIGDTKGALIDYKEALHWNKKDPVAFANRGILHNRLGEKKLALADFEMAIAINHDLTAQFQRIRILSDKKLARESYEKMIKVKPTTQFDYLAIANAHAYFANKEKGIEALNQALSMDASYAVAYYNRAVLRTELGESKEALADYDKYIELNKSNPKAYFNRSLLKDRLNDREGSMNDLKRALELNPKLQLRENAPKPFGLMMS